MRYLKLSLCWILCLINDPVAAQVAESNFAGTWELLSIEERTEAGDWVPSAVPGGGRPVGVIMYDDKGKHGCPNHHHSQNHRDPS